MNAINQKSVTTPADELRELPGEQAMYRALIERDASFEGIFVVGVKTTGIFCRPTCSAKKPHASNVEYFADARAALRAGYRPCKRCHPMDAAGVRRPEWVGRLLEAVEREPGLRIRDQDLREMGIEPARARAYFTRRYGMTFHAYHRARRVGLALNEVRRGRDLLETGRRAGFESDSGFRGAFAKLFGSTPGASRRLEALNASWLDTSLGAMLAIANGDGLLLLEFVDRRMIETQIERLRRLFGGAVIVPGRNAAIESIERELRLYFDGRLTRFTTPIILRGGEFQERVWRRLLDIQFGETLSYGQMAADIGHMGAARAVGRANGDNRLAIIVPCHRVVRFDGTLCGYGGGMWRKKRLIELEAAVVSTKLKRDGDARAHAVQQ